MAYKSQYTGAEIDARLTLAGENATKLEAEMAARADADTKLKADIEGIKSSITDMDLSGYALKTEVEAETTARTEAISGLQSQIDAIDLTPYATTEALDAEVQARKEYEQTVDGKFTGLENSISAETAARTEAVSSLQSQIDAIDLTGYVQKDGDKVLSDNNYTDEDKAKVDSLGAAVANAVTLQGRVATVEELPQEANIGDLYLVGEDSTECDEYLYTTDCCFQCVGRAGLTPEDYVCKDELAAETTARTEAIDGLQTQIDAIDLSNYVQKDGSKVLSDNNFSNEDKAKLDSITNVLILKGSVDSLDELPDAAEVGWVYMVASDGEYDEYVCTAPGTWEYIGSSKIDLSAYALKTEVEAETAARTEAIAEVQSQIDAIDLTVYVQKDGDKVLSDNNFTDEEKAKLASINNTITLQGRVSTTEELPADASVGDMYLVGANPEDACEEYVYTADGRYECIGSTSIDLTPYALKTEVETVNTTLSAQITELDSKVSAEETARIADVANLQKQIDGIEIGSGNGEAVDMTAYALKTELQSETTARTEADTNLQTQIDSIDLTPYATISSMESLIAELQSKIDALEGNGKKQVIFSTHFEFPNVGEDETFYLATDERIIYYWDVDTQTYVKAYSSGIEEIESICCTL